MSTLTINIGEHIKKSAFDVSRKEGVTLTFLISKFLELYSAGKIRFEMIMSEEDQEIEQLSTELTKVARMKLKNKKFKSLKQQFRDVK